MQPIFVIHYNGYSLRELPDGGGCFGDWEEVCWGDPATVRMGRIPTAIHYALICRPARLIWSTGATRLANGESEAEHAFNTAIRRAKDFERDFPDQFSGLMPSEQEFVSWMESVSRFDCRSTNTATSMEEATSLIDEVLGQNTGVVATVTSANHVCRALRDALSVWQHGIVIESKKSELRESGSIISYNKRRVAPLRARYRVTIVAVAAATSWGGKDPTDIEVLDHGKVSVPSEG